MYLYILYGFHHLFFFLVGTLNFTFQLHLSSPLIAHPLIYGLCGKETV